MQLSDYVLPKNKVLYNGLEFRFKWFRMVGNQVMKWCNIFNTWDESSVRREGGGGGMPPTSLQPESREPSTLPLMVWYKEATFPPPTLGPALLTRYGSLLPAHLHDSSLKTDTF